jgi:hypothetical protein
MSDKNAATVELTGSSDDLIELDGALYEEFNYVDNIGEGDFIGFSDGTVLRIEYGRSGVWRITPVVSGTAKLTIEQAPENDDDQYTDKAILEGDVTWAMHGIGIAAAKRTDPSVSP